MSPVAPQIEPVADDITVADYLVTRLRQMGVDHLFGVPGDFVLGFLNQVLKSDLQFVGTCNELNAAYAADGYARIRGIGAFASTFGVGELSALNGVAGAFAEKIPVVVITGSPATAHFRKRPLLHHTLGDYQIPLRMYEHITAASTQLATAATAPAEIDRVLSACVAHQRPVYISLPADVVLMKCRRPGAFAWPTPAPSDPLALREAVREARDMLLAAKAPVVVGGVELIRYKLEAEFAELLAKTGLSFVTMMLGKGVLSEQHPQYLGLFEGDRSREAVRTRVTEADCILELGAWMTDFNTGGFTTHLDDARTICASLRSVKIRHHTYEDVHLTDFLRELTVSLNRVDPLVPTIHSAPEEHAPVPTFEPVLARPLTTERFFDRVSQFLADQSIVIAETGVSLFCAAEMRLPEGATFIGQTFYGSIGYTVGATLGAGMAAPDRRVVLFVGDGAFQMTCQDLSTMIRQAQKPIIFLLNNDGYTIERVISDHFYNDIPPWQYHKLLEVFGGGLALDVRTEGDLEDALEQAASAEGVVFVEVHTGRLDCSESLREAGRSMAETNQLDG